jgi:hypothetical membrane protein
MEHIETLATLTPVQRATAASQTSALSLTRLLLICGATVGPLFVLTVLIQDYTRPDFEPRIHILSLRALGDWGWVQVANFVGAGVLNVLYAVGVWRALRRSRAGNAAAILIGVFGFGLITVGLFTTDPALGFPPNVPTPLDPSWHGVIHALGALFTFLSVAAALAVLSRVFFARQQKWFALYLGASAVTMLLVFFGGFSDPLLMARTLRLAMFIGWMGASIVAMKLLPAISAGDYNPVQQHLSRSGE